MSLSIGNAYEKAAMVASNGGGSLKHWPQTLPPEGSAQTGHARASHGRSRMQAPQTRAVPDTPAHNSHRCGSAMRAASSALRRTLSNALVRKFDNYPPLPETRRYRNYWLSILVPTARCHGRCSKHAADHGGARQAAVEVGAPLERRLGRGAPRLADERP